MRSRSIVAALILLFVSACSSPQEKAEQAASRAMALSEAGNFEAARQAILEAVSLRDDHPERWLLLGRLDLETDRPADALLAYSRVLELDATNIEALQLVSELSFQFGDIREATNAADRVLALDPNATRAILVKGLISLGHQDVPGATSAADTILKIKPQDEFGIILKARALAAGGDHQAAVKLIEEGVPAAQRTEASLATLTELYRVVGDKDQLVATIDKQLAKRPKDPDLKLDLAGVLYKSGNMSRARAILYSLLRAQPDNIEIIGRITDMWSENDPAALSPAQLGEIALNGSHTIRMGVARYLIGSKRPDLAAPILRADTGSAQNASSLEAEALLATVLYAQGNVEAARTIADKILSDDTNNIDALLVRGRIEMRDRNLTAALIDAQIVVRDFPMSEQGRLLLADVYIAKKELQRARQSYEDGISNMPQSILLSRAYVQFLLKTGDRARAIDVARSLTRKVPSSVAGWDLFANTCKQASDSVCIAQAKAGRDRAASVYTVDNRPGSVRSRGLFGRL